MKNERRENGSNCLNQIICREMGKIAGEIKGLNGMLEWREREIER